MLDVSRQTVSRWESGKSVPSSVQLSNLCKAFNIDANNLFDPDAELTADSAVRQPDGVNVEGAKRNIALPLTVELPRAQRVRPAIMQIEREHSYFCL